jgi:rhodanese-related sulfurtransferase
MKCRTIIFSLIASISGLFLSPVYAISGNQETSVNKYKSISSSSCDSLIKANEKNPNFVILDVRTPDVWKADHLSGSINRNYYDGDFSAQITALPKTKLYLLHCQAGSRSAPTLALMKNLNFSEVYEMIGGINSWKSKSLPTTSVLAPKLVLVSNGGVKNGTIQYGMADTLKITLTNRANDTLRFVSMVLPVGDEFSSNLDLKRKLKGAEDYVFSIFYKPKQVSQDSVKVSINSNSGLLTLKIILKKGTVQEVHDITRNEPKIYPNPASNLISFRNFTTPSLQEVSFINLNGQLIKKMINYPTTSPFNLAGFPEGVYIVRIVSENRIYSEKLVLSR